MNYMPTWINEPWNWEALGTWFIGVIACVITWKQFQIEKHKKDDFLFQHRLEVYSELSGALSSICYMLGQIEVVNMMAVKFDELMSDKERKKNQKNLDNIIKHMATNVVNIEKITGIVMGLFPLLKKVEILFTNSKEINEGMNKVINLALIIRNKSTLSVMKKEWENIEKEIEQLLDLITKSYRLEDLCYNDLKSWCKKKPLAK